jgi:hypothetical protein
LSSAIFTIHLFIIYLPNRATIIIGRVIVLKRGAKGEKIQFLQDWQLTEKKRELKQLQTGFQSANG